MRPSIERDPLHICFRCDEYPPARHGGIGTMTQQLGRALHARGHRVTVVGVYASGPWGVESDEGVRVVRLRHTAFPGTGLLINGIRIRREVERLNARHPIDVLEAPEVGLATIGRAGSATRIIRMHGGHYFFSAVLERPRRVGTARVERRSFRHADAYCAVSRFVADVTSELLHLDPGAVEILPNPVDTHRFHPRDDLPEEERLILFAGSVCEKKGIRELIDAMPRILAAVPGARLRVAGRDTEDPRVGGSYTAYLKRRLPPAVAGRVVFGGPVEHHRMPEEYARASVCVFPSYAEAMPMVVLESMAMGKATIISEHGPAAELVEPGVSGLLCDPRDPASIAQRVVSVLRDPALRARLGAGARHRVEERFSLDALVERNERFYRACIGKRSRSS